MKTVHFLKQWALKAYRAPWANRYFLTAAVFLVWMIFFDNHNIITQFHLKHSVDNLERHIQEYEQRYQTALQDQEALDRHPERYGREKYYMQKADEEVYIIKK